MLIRHSQLGDLTIKASAHISGLGRCEGGVRRFCASVTYVTQIQPRLVSLLERTGERWGGKGLFINDTDPAQTGVITGKDWGEIGWERLVSQ